MTPESSTTDKRLGVWDTASLLVGIVVGTVIFKSPQYVFANSGSAGVGLAMWIIGGALCLCGALCYSELATMFPRFGGEYQYLKHAYGQQCGFLYGWMQLCVILTGSIGMMAFVVADYAVPLAAPLQHLKPVVACGAILLLTAVQWMGFTAGTWTQNILSMFKVLSLTAIILLGLGDTGEGSDVTSAVESTVAAQSPQYGLALLWVFLAFGGWNDAAMVTGQVKDYQRNMPRALMVGLGLVTLLYVAVNLAYLNVLGYAGLSRSDTPATDVMLRTLGATGSKVMSLFVICSALGAIHGLLFASSRLLAAIGEDYRAFGAWSRWNRRDAPGMALLTIAGISLMLVAAVGTETGLRITSTCIESIGLPAPDWDRYFGGFDTLFAATAPVFWTFFLLSGISVIVLRFTRPGLPRPFRVPLYPLPVLLFCGSAIFMLWMSFDYARTLVLLNLPFLGVGLLLSLLQRKPDVERSTPV